MTPVEALLEARRHDVRVQVVDGKLRATADGYVPMIVLRHLKEHRDALVRMLLEPRREAPLTVATRRQPCYFASAGCTALVDVPGPWPSVGWLCRSCSAAQRQAGARP